MPDNIINNFGASVGDIENAELFLLFSFMIIATDHYHSLLVPPRNVWKNSGK